ncbi:phage baseplate assembly protein V [Erwinia sp. MYb375]|uniref:phage baseplate assembly protein V n=1 Tax=unclassified Erwinia TaxID=2622719 RepID=UPI0030A30759
MNEFVSETRRQLHNLLRIGTVSEVDTVRARCRVQSEGNLTAWLPWLSGSAGQVRSWHAPSPGEQVLLLALGGELNTAFVLAGIFSDAFPAPSASQNAVHWTFPDGAQLAYEPESGTLTASGIQSARITAAVSITLDAPLVECTQQLKAATFELTGGGTLKGNISHSGGSLSSNGIVVHSHVHAGVESGGSKTAGPQ